MYIKMEIRGTWCNQWPKLRVGVNNTIYFDKEVVDNNTIEFTVPIYESNSLIIQHYDKKFGHNGQWDTVSTDGVITQDRAVELISLSLDDVSITDYVISTCPLVTEQGESVQTPYYGFNGQVEIKFTGPVYEWIINTIVKPKSRKMLDISQPIETSYNNIFNYEQDQLELVEIENILNKNAHLFNKPTKI